MFPGNGTLARELPRKGIQAAPRKGTGAVIFRELRNPLKDQILKNVSNLPETRAAIVEMAGRYWGTVKKPGKQQRYATPSLKRNDFKIRGEAKQPRRQQKPYYRRAQQQRNDSPNPIPTTRNSIEKDGKDGKTNRCFLCENEYHISRDCPNPMKGKGRAQ